VTAVALADELASGDIPQPRATSSHGGYRCVRRAGCPAAGGSSGWVRLSVSKAMPSVAALHQEEAARAAKL
jgi:hypothetical protein